MRRLVREAAIAALECEALVPPPRPTSFPDGPTAELRDAMARFSSGPEHRSRRARVRDAISDIDLPLLRREVSERTTALAKSGVEGGVERGAKSGVEGGVERGAKSGVESGVEGGVEAVGSIGLVVPTQALLAVLRVDLDEVPARAADVSAVVAVIGRGRPIEPGTEAATRRLIDHFADHRAGPVAAISMLYQNHDATAALFASTLLARASTMPRENALARTIRTATEPTDLADTHVDAGETVEVSLNGDDMEFGRGIHACPGQDIAVEVVDAMVAAIEVLDLTVDLSTSTIGRDGRPATLMLRR